MDPYGLPILALECVVGSAPARAGAWSDRHFWLLTCPAWVPSVGRWVGSERRAKDALPPAVIAWRTAHGLIAAGFVLAIGYVWWCALTGRRGRPLRSAIAGLV
jgi:hypothetical protein